MRRPGGLPSLTVLVVLLFVVGAVAPSFSPGAIAGRPVDVRALGTTRVPPTFIGNAGVGVYVNNQASFLITIPTGTTFLLYQTARTASTCGVLSTIETNGTSATKLVGSIRTDGLAQSAVEVWYEKNPPTGTVPMVGSARVWGNWTATCSVGTSHIISVIGLGGVSEDSPFSTITILNDGGTPDASLVADLGIPATGQLLSVAFSDISSTGAGDMRFADPVGTVNDWGFLHTGVGTTYCDGFYPDCGEGGFATGIVSADTGGSQTFYWAGSSVLINGKDVATDTCDPGDPTCSGVGGTPREVNPCTTFNCRFVDAANASFVFLVHTVNLWVYIFLVMVVLAAIYVREQRKKNRSWPR